MRHRRVPASHSLPAQCSSIAGPLLNPPTVLQHFQMAYIQFRIDDELRDKAQAIAAEMGLDLTTAVRMFLHQMVRQKGLPFRPTAEPEMSAERSQPETAADGRPSKAKRRHSSD